MESKSNGSGTKPERANFMAPQFPADETLRKREEFAVSLRKKKTKDLVQ
jgi:hypothetical protein